MSSPMMCPECGKTGKQSGEWVRPGIAAGELIAGLDPETCVGCWDTMSQNGIVPGTFTTDRNGNQKFEPIPRPVVV